MTQNLQLTGLMASILGFAAVAGLTIGARFQTVSDVSTTAEVQPIASPSPKSARRVRTPKVEVRLTYEGVSLNSSEGADEGMSASIPVSEPANPAVSDGECSASAVTNAVALNGHCLGLMEDENSSFANLARPYFTSVDEKLR